MIAVPKNHLGNTWLFLKYLVKCFESPYAIISENCHIRFATAPKKRMIKKNCKTRGKERTPVRIKIRITAVKQSEEVNAIPIADQSTGFDPSSCQGPITHIALIERSVKRKTAIQQKNGSTRAAL